MEKKSQKPHLTDYSLLMVQDLWLAYYQILLIILVKKLIKLNANLDPIMKNVKHVELNAKITIAILNTQTLKMV